MFNILLYKSKHFLFVLIKLSAIGGAFFIIIQKLTLNQQLSINNLWLFLNISGAFSANIVIFLLFLTGFNWCLEITKWQMLVSKLSAISFKMALRQSLTALTVSIITPNRIGDYGAKALFYPNYLRGKILLLNFIGNFWQMAATVIFGLCGLLVLITQFNYLPIKFKLWHLILPLAFLGILIIYKKLKNYQIRGYSLAQIEAFLKRFSLKEHLKIGTVSVLRYLVFSFQLYFLLNLFGADLTYLNAIAGISAMYLLASLVPIFHVFDVAIKGSIAVVIFNLFNVTAITALSAVTCMWLLNVVFPAILGSLYLFNFKVVKTA